MQARRLALGIRPGYYRVDTCAAEFEAFTPYLYSTYESGDETEPTQRRKVLILGGGPNRIGQGIEFDYCCVQACAALRELGFETIMVNCNPETVSTDYDTADRLYFEPLTLEDVLNVIDAERPEGVIVQFGGQTPINLARGLAEAGAPIWGTPTDSIDLAEDRVRFGELLQRLEIPHPDWGNAQSLEAARRVAARIGYPVLVRPSYVLGGRAMEIAYDDASLAAFLALATEASPDGPVLIDHYLEDAFEIDVDALADGERVVLAGVMQHIEEAGRALGRQRLRAAALQDQPVPPEHHPRLHRAAGPGAGRARADERAVRHQGRRGLRAGGEPARLAHGAVCQQGHRRAGGAAGGAGDGRPQPGRAGVHRDAEVGGFFVKEAVLPFKKFPGADYRLGPEMKSTGEVMGHASHFGHAFAKAQIAAGTPLPLSGAALITVNDFDKGAALKIGRDLHRLGFALFATPARPPGWRGRGCRSRR